jgi:8-oxo-dGTP pyrophosphatase MutT (NUDIX family)
MLNFNIDQGVRSMKESVSAVFVSKSRVYFIKRQNYLPVFPGYHATPGGKVDKADPETKLGHNLWPVHIPPKILHALIREVKEELDYDLNLGMENGEIESILDIGIAITPEFNPYRFKNYYIKISLKEEIEFAVDTNEAL